MQIKALHFDIFGTVVDWRESIAKEFYALLDGKLSFKDCQTFADSWRARYQPSMEKVRNGQRAWVSLDELHRENLIALLSEYGEYNLIQEQIDNLNFAWHRLDPWPDAVAGLTRLKSHFVLATLSNGNISLIVNMAKHAALPWDVILGAEIAQSYKPHNECYIRNASILGLYPEECMMVAAHNNDLIAARQIGFKTAFVYRRTEYGCGQKTDLEPNEKYDLIAENLIDLAEKLGC